MSYTESHICKLKEVILLKDITTEEWAKAYCQTNLSLESQMVNVVVITKPH